MNRYTITVKSRKDNVVERKVIYAEDLIEVYEIIYEDYIMIDLNRVEPF